MILGPLFISPRIAYSVYAIFGLLTLNETFLLAKKTGSRPNRPLGLMLFAVLFFWTYLMAFGYRVYFDETILLGGGILLAIVVSEVFRKGNTPFESFGVTISGTMYTAASFLGILYFIGYRSDLPQPWIVVSLFALIWVNDSAAYLIGRKVGRNKLFERLSPNKTIEGSLAGLVFALAAGFGLAQIQGMPDLPVMLGFSAVCVTGGSLGDLLESRIKRAAGVKDSGIFLPGHGGFFDRFDAMMLAIPSSILFFELVLPKT